jgi:ribA/ribD-fused uncharacterized protein
MKKVIQCKFDQNIELKKKLIETKGMNLIEDSKTDNFWGIGKKRKGKNMLGVILMEIRDNYINGNN